MKKTFSLFLMMIFLCSGLLIAQSKTQSQKQKKDPVKKEQTNQAQTQQTNVKNQNQNSKVKAGDQKIFDPGTWGNKPKGQGMDGKGNDVIQNPNKNDAKIKPNVKAGNKVFDPGQWGVNKNKQKDFGKVKNVVTDPNKVNAKVNTNVNKAASGLPTGKRQVAPNVNKVSPDVIDPAKKNIKVDKPTDVKMKAGKTVKGKKK